MNNIRIGRICLGFVVILILLLPGLIGIIALRTKIGFWWIVASVAMGGYIAVGRKSFNWPVRIVLIASSIALTLVIADLGARWLLQDLIYYGTVDRLSTKWDRLPLVERFFPNQHVIHKEYGDLAAISGDPEDREYRMIEFITDKYGFRNKKSDPANVDLLVVGDSFAGGMGTTQNKTFTMNLEDRYKLTAVNMALPANPWEEYVNTALMLPQMDLSDKAAIIWMLFPANDMGGYYSDTWNIDELPWKSGLDAFLVRYETFRYRSPIRILLYRISLAQPGTFIRKTLPDGKPVLFYGSYVDEVVKDITVHRNYGAFVETIKQMARLADKHDVSLVIVVAPSKEEVYDWLVRNKEPWITNTQPSSMSAELTKLSEQENYCFIDLKPALTRHARQAYETDGSLLWWRDDTHWNERGHRLVADELASSECLSGVMANKSSAR